MNDKPGKPVNPCEEIAKTLDGLANATSMFSGVKIMPCPCGCGRPYSYVPTFVENVLDFARSLGSPGCLVIANEAADELGIARLKVALEFERRVKRDPGFFVRAVIEEWDAPRLTRELY